MPFVSSASAKSHKIKSIPKGELGHALLPLAQSLTALAMSRCLSSNSHNLSQVCENFIPDSRKVKVGPVHHCEKLRVATRLHTTSSNGSTCFTLPTKAVAITRDSKRIATVCSRSCSNEARPSPAEEDQPAPNQNTTIRRPPHRTVTHPQPRRCPSPIPSYDTTHRQHHP